MNLFLILWFADICDNTHDTMVGLVVLTIILAIILFFITLIIFDHDITFDDLSDKTKYILKKVLKIWSIFLVSLIIISTLLPSSRTVYIATGFNEISKATHTVAESDTAKKAIELLNIKLDEYIKESKSDK